MYSMVPFRMHRSLSRPSAMMSSLFDDHFLRSFFNMNDMMGSFGFRVDIRENDCSYLMEAELPGVDEKNIDISVENDVLTISADLNVERKDERNCYSERRYGHMTRAFNLEGIEQDKIVASHKNGILYITLPKMKPEEKKTSRKISINTVCGQDDNHCDCENQ